MAIDGVGVDAGPRLLDAHDPAVSVALKHLERFGSTTRIRPDSRRLHPDSLGLMMSTFRQTTSRARRLVPVGAEQRTDLDIRGRVGEITAGQAEIVGTPGELSSVFSKRTTRRRRSTAVRNRELLTVTGVHHDGALTVSSHRGAAS